MRTVTLPENQVVESKHVFSQEEKLEKAEAIAFCEKKIRDLEKDRGQINKEIKEVKQEVSLNLEHLYKGYTFIDRRCKVELDFMTFKKRFIDAETNELVKEVDMSDSDRQMEMSFFPEIGGEDKTE